MVFSWQDLHLNFDYFYTSKIVLYFRTLIYFPSISSRNSVPVLPFFFFRPYPYPYPYPNFQMIPSPYCVRTMYFKFRPYSVLIPSVLWARKTESVRNPSPYFGVCPQPKKNYKQKRFLINLLTAIFSLHWSFWRDKPYITDITFFSRQFQDSLLGIG